MVNVIENLLSNDLADSLESILTSHMFPWYWRSSSKYGTREEGQASEDFQFVHIIFYDGVPQSELFELVRSLLVEFENKTNITIKNIHKIKANLLTKQQLSDDALNETIHTDIDSEKYLTIIYYVIDSDGDTVIYDSKDTQVNPRKNSAVYFQSNKLHRATPPIENKRRIVLNIIVEI